MSVAQHFFAMFEEPLHLLSLSRRRRTKRFRHDVSAKIGALDISKLDITRCNVALDEEHGVFNVSHTVGDPQLFRYCLGRQRISEDHYWRW